MCITNSDLMCSTAEFSYWSNNNFPNIHFDKQLVPVERYSATLTYFVGHERQSIHLL